METPNNCSSNLTSKRIHTPRIAERRKSLFTDNDTNNVTVQQQPKEIELSQDSLDGICPLTPEQIKNYQGDDADDALTKSIKSMLKKCPPKTISLLKHHQSNDKLNINSNTYKSPNHMQTRSGSKVNNFTTHNNNVNLVPNESPANKLSTKTLMISPLNILQSPITPPNKRNCTEELGILFKSSLNFKNEKRKSVKESSGCYEESINLSYTDDEDINELPPSVQYVSAAQKRIQFNSDDKSPPRKIFKTDQSEMFHSNDKLMLIDASIPTKLFYSNKENKQEINKYSLMLNSTQPPENESNVLRKKRKRIKSKTEKKVFNRGVGHGIKRKPHAHQSKSKKVSVDKFLKNVQNKKFKLLPSNRMSPKKIEIVHKILASNQNCIQMAKPLNITVNEDIDFSFSDIENDASDDDAHSTSTKTFADSSLMTVDNLANTRSNNKIFKSGKNSLTTKQISITNNIKGTIQNGKISFNTKKLKRKKPIRKSEDSFLVEQASVNKIIEELDYTCNNESKDKDNFCPSTEEHKEIIGENNIDIITTLRNRLPYNTTDPKIIEQQYLLLDFLITNNICTEKNFHIFIANPDKHKEEADRICNSLVCIAATNPICNIENNHTNKYRKLLPYKTNNPSKIEQQHLLLDFLIENEICTDETFKYFITDPDNHIENAKEIVNNLLSSTEQQMKKTNFQIDGNSKILETEIDDSMEIENNRNSKPESLKLFSIFHPGKCQPIIKKSTRKISRNILRGAIGLNQYQIDAGQKEYGAKQCNQCGLLYTLHEPEEERIHMNYHNSMHILKFRSWIDEDIVNNYPEWGDGGRIIRLTNSCQFRKKERLMEILKIVDQELGFSSYILPSKFVAFLAIRKHQIVGLCLVQFLNSANKYISLNDVDCCTEEVFEARCGISRIWVSPFHRRLHIATKMILAVQNHTFIGETIDLNKIAFSSPTEAGKQFAQTITKREDFLVYQ